MTTQHPAAPAIAEGEIDYDEAIAHCFKTLGHPRGTKGCIAFVRGAEWYHRAMLASAPPAPARKPSQPLAISEEEIVADEQGWMPVKDGCADDDFIHEDDEHFRGSLVMGWEWKKVRRLCVLINEEEDESAHGIEQGDGK